MQTLIHVIIVQEFDNKHNFLSLKNIVTLFFKLNF